MALIHLTTKINGSIEKCFDAARSVDVHLASTSKTSERAVAGRTSGLCEAGETVTWEARHFGIKQKMTVEITKVNPPTFFEDRMVKGAFKSMRHEHHFEKKDGGTLMTDKFQYEVPLGLLGRLFDSLVLKPHMTKFLLERNRVLKEVVEDRRHVRM